MANWPIRFTYRDRAVLYFASICSTVLFLNLATFGNMNKLLECRPAQEMKIYDVHRLGLFSLAHKNAAHLTNNFATILMLGPNQEARFGHSVLMTMFAVCSVVTGVTNMALFKTPLVGANSVVFAFLILYASHYVSFHSRETQTLPLTFVLVFTFWLNKEISLTMQGDGSSGIAHIVGGIAGASFVLKPWEDKSFLNNVARFFEQLLTAVVDTAFEFITFSPSPSSISFDELPTYEEIVEYGAQVFESVRDRVSRALHTFHT